jgi:microcompartment protein CcmK/EutM
MRFGIVVGNVVSTIKNEKLHGIRLAVVQPLDMEENVMDGYEIVGDYLGSAVGNIILWTEDGDTICSATDRKNVPLRGSIVAIIDRVDFESEGRTIKG